MLAKEGVRWYIVAKSRAIHSVNTCAVNFSIWSDLAP